MNPASSSWLVSPAPGSYMLGLRHLAQPRSSSSLAAMQVILWLAKHQRPTCPDSDVLGHLRDQGQPVQRCLIDAAHLVVHKQAGQEDSQREYLGAVLPCLQAGQGVRPNAATAWQGHAQARTRLPASGRACLVPGINALRVQQEQLVGGPVHSRPPDWRTPHPETLCAGPHTGGHLQQGDTAQ